MGGDEGRGESGREDGRERKWERKMVGKREKEKVWKNVSDRMRRERERVGGR